jgi:hypothetical protein
MGPLKGTTQPLQHSPVPLSHTSHDGRGRDRRRRGGRGRDPPGSAIRAGDGSLRARRGGGHGALPRQRPDRRRPASHPAHPGPLDGAALAAGADRPPAQPPP